MSVSCVPQLVQRWWANRASNRTCPITFVPVTELTHPFRIVNDARKVEVYDAMALITSLEHGSPPARSPLTRTRLTPVELLRLYHLAKRQGWEHHTAIALACIRAQKMLFSVLGEYNMLRQSSLRRSMWRLLYLGLSQEGRNIAQDPFERAKAETLFKKLLFTHLVHGRKRTLLLLDRMDALFSEMSRRKRKRVLVRRHLILRLQRWCIRYWKLEAVFPLAIVSPRCMSEAFGAVASEDTEEVIDDFYVPKLETMFKAHQRVARVANRFEA